MSAAKNVLNGRYVAYASRVVEDEGGILGSGVEFEMMASERVSAFLTRDRNALESSQNEEYRWLLRHYLEHGTESTEFYLKKLAYFGDAQEIYYLTVWFDDSEIKQIKLTSWYNITITGSEGYDCYVESFVYVDGNRTITKCYVEESPQKENLTLETLFRLRSIDEDNHPSADEQLKQINNKTLFYGVNIYYVGAALCVGFYSAVDNVLGLYGPQRNEGYFDFGFSSGRECHDTFIQDKAIIADLNLETIKADLISQPEKTIIISHWHKDHISIVGHILSAEYDAFWAKSCWYAPVTTSMVANIVAMKLRESNRIKVLPNSKPANNYVYTINGNPNLTYGKIDAFPDNPHPHHHGIYACIRFVDQAGYVGETILLTGDCTYSGIPTSQKVSIAYLQASHHGGNYALSPSEGDRTVHIPVPSNDPKYCRSVIYSANGATHGHPKGNFVMEHYDAGWTIRYFTHFAASGKIWVENCKIV